CTALDCALGFDLPLSGPLLGGDAGAGSRRPPASLDGFDFPDRSWWSVGCVRNLAYARQLHAPRGRSVSAILVEVSAAMSHGRAAVEAVEPTKPTDPERLPMGKVLGVAVIGAIVFGVSVLWAERVLRREDQSVAPAESARIPPEVGRSQIGMVNQRLFELEAEALRKRQEQEMRLNSYGWVDRDKEIIHVPIERAMEQMAAESKP